jgi:hypothetical protein
MRLTKMACIAAGMAAASLAAAADPALLNLLPPQAPMIFGVQVEQSRYSPFGQFLLAQAEKQNGDLKEFIAVTGFDPRRDVTEMVGAAQGPGKGGLVCVRGRFDIPRILAAVQAKHKAGESYRGVTVLLGRGHRPGALAFLDSTLAVAGDAASVKAAIDRWRDGGAIPPQTAAQVSEAALRYDAWLVTSASPAELAGRIPDDTVKGTMQGDLIRAIERMSGGIKFGADVTIAGESVLKTDKDAAALADVLRFLVSLAQLQGNAEARARLGDYARQMQLAAEGNRVKVTLVIPEAEFEKLILGLEKRPARPRSPAAD